MSALPKPLRPAERPLVSVIMANRDGGRYIAAAIDSVRRQSLGDLELIVADDGSRDDSVTIVEAAMAEDPRIRLIRCAASGGPAAARNRALSQACGAWIAVMDADDLMAADRLERLTAAAQSDDADIVADDLVVFKRGGAAPSERLLTGGWGSSPRWIDAADYVARNRFYGRGPNLGFLKPLIRAAAFPVHVLRYDESLRIGEDYDVVLRLLLAGGQMRIYPLPLYRYRKHANSISHRLDEAALLAIRAADRQLCEMIPAGDRRLDAAWTSRQRSIERALRFETLLTALKRREWARATAIAFHHPTAAALLRLPLAARIERAIPRRRGDSHPQRRDTNASVAPAVRVEGAMTASEAGPEVVTVCVCTFRRPSGLAEAMASVAGQRLPPRVQLSLVVVDNDREPSAQALVERFAAAAKFPVAYRHCPGENISIARNGALDAVATGWLAFLDDDERADPDWLAELLAHSVGCQAVFGPCEAVYAEQAPLWLRRGDFHSNRIAHRRGAIETGHTCNALIDVAFVRRHGLRFDIELGRSGGEDTIFFHSMRRCGATLAYAPKAIVFEEVAAGRATVGWVARRRYRAGQTYALMLRRFSPRRYALWAWASPVKIVFCSFAGAATGFDSARASRWAMRGMFHLGGLSYVLGFGIHQEYAPRRASWT
jgi:glycosyltransferase involved in cell wall biosynthesis